VGRKEKIGKEVALYVEKPIACLHWGGNIVSIKISNQS
jgi:hypothetical protein